MVTGAEFAFSVVSQLRHRHQRFGCPCEQFFLGDYPSAHVVAARLKDRHADMIDMDEEDFEQLRDQMEVGGLLLRFVRLYERLEKQ